MAALRAVIFDLGGTLLDFPNWDEEMPHRWRTAHAYLKRSGSADPIPEDEFVQAMVEAEQEHWRRVDTEHWSGPPSGMVAEGFRRMSRPLDERMIIAVLDACALAVDGWAQPFPDTIATLRWVREHGFRTGLLSNTWWAAGWHNADLATHGLHPFLDELVYTSDLPHSKPHPEAFRTVADRLGVPQSECLMIGNRPADDVGGGLAAGMLAVLKTNGRPVSVPADIRPTATIAHLADLPPLLERLLAL